MVSDSMQMFNINIRFWFLTPFFIFIFISCFSPLAHADWINLGLYGGQVYEIAIDPGNPSNKMFAGTYYGGGLYVTNDGGSNWKEVLTGHEDKALDGEATFRNTAVWAVKVAPSHNNVIWVAHNYWAEKSTDGGETWTHIYNRDMQGSAFRYCRSLVIDPINPNTVYVGTGGANSTDYGGTIYKHTVDDLGEVTWTKMGPNSLKEFPYKVVEVDINPMNRNVVFALDSNDSNSGHLYLSTNGGLTWSENVVNITSFIGETGLAVKPNEPNIVFIATYNGIMRIEYPKDSSGNILWNNTPSVTWPGGAVYNIRALAFAPNNPNILFAAGGDTKLGRSSNGGTTFTWYETGEQFINLAVHPTDNSIIWGGGRNKGVYKGVQYSNFYTWTAKKEGMNAIRVNDIDVDPNDTNHILAATMAGVYEKQGDSAWKATAQLNYVESFSVAFDPSDNSGASYYAGAESYLYRTTDHGKSWTRSNYLGYPHYVNDISVDPNKPSTVYITTRNPGRVYRSTNSGENLTSITPSGAYVDFNAVVVNKNNSDNIFAGSGNFFNNAGQNGNVYKSNDGGESWTAVLSNIVVNDLAIDPNNSNIIYSGCGHSSRTDVPLHKSINGGTTWQKSYEGMPGEPTRFGVWGSGEGNVYVLRHTGSISKGGEDDMHISHFGPTEWSEIDIGDSAILHDIWGDSALNVFAVGESGKILRFTGSSWSTMATPTSGDLYGVWGSIQPPNKVIAVGKDGTVLLFNGSIWSPMTSNSTKDLQSIWGNANGSRFFAVGVYGTILIYNGSSWSTMVSNTSVTFEDVWGTSETDVYAVGDATQVGSNRYYTIYHYNGESWSRMTNTPLVSAERSGKLRAIWGSSANDIWVAGDDGVILRYNGTNWTAYTPISNAALYDIWGSSSDNIYFVGMYNTIRKRYLGSWSSVEPTDSAIWNPVTDLAFNAAGKLYASTSRQGIYASANQARNWTSLSAPPYETYAVSSGSIIVGSQAGTYSLDGEGILYGVVSNNSGTRLGGSTVSTNLGKSLQTNHLGEWQMHHRGGYYNVSAFHPGYHPYTHSNVEVYDATFTYVGFNLTSTVPSPEVSNIPDQTIPIGGTFTNIRLDSYVTDPDNTDAEINWAALDKKDLSINFTNRVAKIYMPSGWNKSETITFRATDPQGFTASDTVKFMVDSDGDGVADAYDTNSIFPDDDHDGMPNFWESYHGLNPKFDDAAQDADGDGDSNLDEYLAGTDPQDPSSRSVTFCPGILILLNNN